jgi:transcriptional regulator with XRE-family HTH domain
MYCKHKQQRRINVISDKIKALLALSGKKQIDLARLFDMSKQTMNNKMAFNRFSADELIKIAEFTGCKIGFLLSDGQHIFLEPDDAREPK